MLNWIFRNSVIYQHDLQVWIQQMLLTDTLIRSEWSPECHHAHRCCVSECVKTADPAGDNINKVIAEMSPCPQVLYISRCWNSCIQPKIISAKWLSEYHLDLWTWLNSVMVADVSALRSELGQIANGEQTT